MYENVTAATGTISVDGARFRPDTGEWLAPVRTGEGQVGNSRLEEGLVSVDGAWFDLARGCWVAAPSRGVDEVSRSSVPAGFVSVDGALLPVEQS